MGVHPSHPTQPLREAGAVNGVGSHLGGEEDAPACRVGDMGEAGKGKHVLGGETGTNLFLYPHPSFLQTFFFNVFESPSELFDMPIFIMVSFSKCRSCPLSRAGRCLGLSLCPPPRSTLVSQAGTQRVRCPARVWAEFTVFPYF